ncbi:FAD-binding oxidoreductase [Pseudokineococcus basanitobsidens]|uniref:FAD-binding oxidoreductase n=1 Tax=Pseudokineococcus basanitobsidens TaxID=1926649 RepID=A0ABU8RPM4_9ACTN
MGAGIVGLCTAYALLERGVDVRVYEQGVPGSGQSGGRGRILRHAHADPRLISATRQSRDLYDRWGAALGLEMVSRDGAVAIGPSVEASLPVLQEAGVAAYRIEADELARCQPLLARYDGPAVLDERGGSIRTTAVIESLVGALGDRLVDDEVLTVRPVAGEVEVRSGGTTNRYDRVAVCAGRGTSHLARTVGLALPVQDGAHVRLTFAVRGPAPARLATLQDSSGEFGETGVYAAAVPGNTEYAVGLSETTRARDDASLPDPAELADLAGRASAYVERALPGLDPAPVDVRHCWVTTLPWGEDGMGVWAREGIFFPAGHNLWKQAPALGTRLAAALAGETLHPDLAPESRLGSD